MCDLNTSSEAKKLWIILVIILLADIVLVSLDHTSPAMMLGHLAILLVASGLILAIRRYDQKKSESLRLQNEADLRIAAAAFETHDGILVTNSLNQILRVNQAFTKITGYSQEEVIGKLPSFLSSGQQNANFYRVLWESVKLQGHWQGEISNRRKNGEIYPEHLHIFCVLNQKGEVENYVGSFTDISNIKSAETAIHNLAFYDPLTHLPNRRLLMDRLGQAVASSVRNQDVGALLFIDLDHFKRINDAKGHEFGDAMLTEVARRLAGCVRADDTIARLGGDEFVVLLEDLGDGLEQASISAENVADKIIHAVGQPYRLQDGDYFTSPSIGITLIRDHEASVEEILKHAESAMYHAKNAGRNTLCFFDPTMQSALEKRVQMESWMRDSLGKHFHLYYQVQIDRQGKAIGAEALIRWQHPEKGIISPGEFIPLAEETGMIIPIGQWVLETACAELKIWERDNNLSDLWLAINVSSRQFQQPDFVEQVRSTIERFKLKSTCRLKLELTESVVLNDLQDTHRKMSALKAMGVKFSMDDFGTGYSSLAYLTQLQFDQLKIDQSFIRNMTKKPTDAVIIQTIIGMGQTLGMEIIAEGVETVEQHDFLMQHQCDAFQGYLFSKPVPIEAFKQLMRS
jgi:diguanylate cyclase (GGDEF)-like protein/PAS domain S-box-containing protein